MAKKWPELKKFIPKNPEKYVGDVNDIVMRSSWEIKFAHYCDINPSIIQWNSEGVKIPYWSREDNKMRTYHLDFVIIVKTYTGIKTMLIEIKPYKQTIKPVKTRGKKESSFLNEMAVYNVNMDKWTHATAYAKERNWQFVIMTEEELYNVDVRK